MKNLFVFTILFFIFSWFQDSSSVYAAGSVNVAITECALGTNGIDVSYDLIPEEGYYSNIDVDEVVTRNGSVIYSESDGWAGNVTCTNFGCTCDWGSPCPPGWDFSTTANTYSSDISANITYTWNYCDTIGNCTTETITSAASCQTPAPPPPDPCGPNVYWYQTAVEPDTCGEDTCASGQRCESNGSGTPQCTPRSECYAQQSCSPAYWYQSPVDTTQCGQGVCGEAQRCETLGGGGVCNTREECTASCGPPVYWYTITVDPNTCGDGGCTAGQRCESNGGEPTCTDRSQCIPTGTPCTNPVTGTPEETDCGIASGCPNTQYCQAGSFPICADHTVCGSGPGANCASVGEECNQINTPCCDGSQTCEFNSWANTQICISAEPMCDVGVAGDQICQGICTFGGSCIPINPNEPDNGGTCDCTAGSGGISEETTYEDEEAIPPTYVGPIVDFESMLSNLYKLLLPIAIGLAGIPLVALAGYRIMTSQGDPDQLKEGKEDLTATVAGMLYLLLALTILRIVLSNFLGT